MSAAVVVDHISHQYGPRTALDNVSFGVDKGECFGLLGPNGGGKTTLFRILSTLLTPTSGSARIFGDSVIEGRDRVRNNIGVVFQSPSLDIYLTAGENLLHGGHLYGLSGQALEDRIRENLQLLAVLDRQNDRVKTLSGGLRRRVEIAKCLLHRPPLLILDEPSTGLDPVARREMWDCLDRMRGESGCTLLVTTHDMEEAERCNRVVILDHGKTVAFGKPDELKSQIGRRRINIKTKDALQLAAAIERRFRITPKVNGDSMYIIDTSSPEMPGALMNEFGDSIESLTIGKPTLADVFMQVTGRSFEAEAVAA